MSTASAPVPWVTRSVELAEDVTWDLFMHPYRPAFSFLNRQGEYMREQATETVYPAPITVPTWAQAVYVASTIDAHFIVSFKEKRVLFRRASPTGVWQWWPAVPFPHPSIKEIDHAEASRYEPRPDGSQPPRKHRSGAQKRRRARAAQ